jgi:hypothetical protein
MKYFRINNEPWVPFFFEKKIFTISKPTFLIYFGNLKKTPIFIKEWVKNKWLY